MKYEFQVGDRVAAVVDYPSQNGILRRGDTGTVVRIADWMDNLAMVRWDDAKAYGGQFHSCEGACEDGYGWNVLFKEIELIEPAGGMNQDFDMSESEILTLLGGVV